MNLREARSFLSRTVSKTRYAARVERNLDFAIDTDYVMDLLAEQQGLCALTGWPLEFTRGPRLTAKTLEVLLWIVRITTWAMSRVMYN